MKNLAPAKGLLTIIVMQAAQECALLDAIADVKVVQDVQDVLIVVLAALAVGQFVTGDVLVAVAADALAAQEAVVEVVKDVVGLALRLVAVGPEAVILNNKRRDFN